MGNFKKNFFNFKILLSLLLSAAILLSFRYTLIYDTKLGTILVFLIFQFVIWTAFFLSNKKINLIFINLFIIIFLNLIITPLFYKMTFDVPIRRANDKQIIEYKRDFFKGMFNGTHVISTDKKGYRTNKKINYEEKPKETLRVITIGGSTTEEDQTDDKKTWSNLLVENLSKHSNKEIELINMGMSGLRSKYHYLSLIRAKKYQPDIVIFLLGVNDWVNHIINRDKSYLIPFYEIKYDFKKSPLFKVYEKINRQVSKIFTKKHEKVNKQKLSVNLTTEEKIESIHLSWMNSLENRKIVKSFEPEEVSKQYSFWLSYIIKECKNNKFKCFFADQPNGYKKNVSSELKKRFWMTPPYRDYTLTLDNMIKISFFYNNWLKNHIINNKLNFCLLSNKLEPSTNYFFDDVHLAENGSKKVAKFLSECIKLNFNFKTM